MDIVKAHERIRYGNSQPDVKHLKHLKASLAEVSRLEASAKRGVCPKSRKHVNRPLRLNRVPL